MRNAAPRVALESRRRRSEGRALASRRSAVTPPAARVQNSAAVGEGGGFHAERRVSTAERQRSASALPPASRQQRGGKMPRGAKNAERIPSIGSFKPSFLSHKSQKSVGTKKRSTTCTKKFERAQDLKNNDRRPRTSPRARVVAAFRRRLPALRPHARVRRLRWEGATATRSSPPHRPSSPDDGIVDHRAVARPRRFPAGRRPRPRPQGARDTAQGGVRGRRRAQGEPRNARRPAGRALTARRPGARLRVPLARGEPRAHVPSARRKATHARRAGRAGRARAIALTPWSPRGWAERREHERARTCRTRSPPSPRRRAVPRSPTSNRLRRPSRTRCTRDAHDCARRAYPVATSIFDEKQTRSVRAAFAAPAGARTKATFGSKRVPTPPRRQRRVLGLLTAIGARGGARRAWRRRRGTEPATGRRARRGPYRAGADAAGASARHPLGAGEARGQEE